MRLPFSISRIIGLALIIASAIMFLVAYSAQSGMDAISNTNDPILQQRLTALTDLRDASTMIAIGCLFLGLFTIFVVSERSISITVSENQMIGSARSASDVVSALSLQGNAIYLPAKHGLTKEKLFLPAPRNGVDPPSALSDDLTLSPGKDGSSPGILAEPIGLSILDSIEKEMNVSLKGADIESAEGMLQVLKLGLGIMKDFHFKERDGKFILRVEYSGLLDACRTVKKERPDTCRQSACIGCSCLLTGAARATGKTVRIEDVDNITDRVVFTLSLEEW